MSDPSTLDAIIAGLATVVASAISAVVALVISLRRETRRNGQKLDAVEYKVNGRMGELIDLLSSARDHLIDGTTFHPDEVPKVVAAVGPPPPPPVTLVFGRAWATSTPEAAPGEPLPAPTPTVEPSSSTPATTDDAAGVPDSTSAPAPRIPAAGADVTEPQKGNTP